MEGTEALHKEKIISEQEYSNEQSQYQNNFLSYMEATHKLQQLLKDIPNLRQKIKDVSSLANFEAAKSLLQESFDDISVTTKKDGIVLFPEQNSDGDKKLQVGYEVKKGDVLFVIGDLSGLAITANISENDINRLKPGREVMISFAAQPDLHLQGKIVSIAKQATLSDSGFSTFPVVINVPTLSQKQIQKIRVGMNAKIDITIHEPPVIKVPIKAIFQEAGKNWIKKVDVQTGTIQTVEVEAGETNLEEVIVSKGLNEGEKVIVGG
jgi:multidrug resistance efflux pump